MLPTFSGSRVGHAVRQVHADWPSAVESAKKVACFCGSGDCRGQGRHQRFIHSKLHSTPRGQAIGDDFNPPVIFGHALTKWCIATTATTNAVQVGARHPVHLGELSAARQALTSSALAPGTPETLQELRDPDRRPAEPYEALSHEVLDFQCFSNLQRARKGAAPCRTLGPHS